MKKNKRMGKKTTLFVIVMCIMCMISACKWEKERGAEESVENNILEYIEDTEDVYFQVEAKVEQEQPEELYSYQVKLNYPDAKQLCDTFIPNTEKITTTEVEGTDNYVCRAEDGSAQASVMDAVEFADMNYLYYYILLSTGDDNHLFPESFPEICPVDALDFMSPQEAQKIVKEYANKLGIDLADEAKVCEGITGSNLQSIYEKELNIYKGNYYLEDGKDYSNDAGCYYMLWEALCPHGEKMIDGNYCLGNMNFTSGSYVVAIVGSNGLDFFFTNAIYTYKGEEKVETLLSVSEAVGEVKKQYENVILSENNQIMISEISLRYVAKLVDIDKGIIKIVPAWCLWGTSGEETKMLWMIDAENGEIL